MDARTRGGGQTAEHVGLLVFFVVLIFSDWLGYAASHALFRWYPRVVPDTFYLVLDAARREGPYRRYVPVSWNRLAETKEERGVQSYRLSVPNGYIPGPKMQFSFSVLEDDGRRQLVEVSTTGVITSRSRYEAFADRVVPIAYQSYAWGHESGGGVPTFVILGCVVALLAGLATGFAVKRLVIPRLTA